MKVYIAGPMSGMPDDNYPAFARAAERLRAVGYEVRSPHEGGATPEEAAMSLRMGAQFRETPEYAGILRRTMGMLLECDAICLLTGWQHSKGASAEHRVAEALGMRQGNVDDYIVNKQLGVRWMGAPECTPRRGYEGDAGFDLVVAEATTVSYGGTVDVPMGVRVEMPEGMWGLLTGRSSTLRNRGLLVNTSIIDNGYRGDLFALVRNMTEGKVEIEKGERIAQLIPMRLEAPSMELLRVDELSDSDRGVLSFGSTGL